MALKFPRLRIVNFRRGIFLVSICYRTDSPEVRGIGFQDRNTSKRAMQWTPALLPCKSSIKMLTILQPWAGRRERGRGISRRNTLNGIFATLGFARGRP